LKPNPQRDTQKKDLSEHTKGIKVPAAIGQGDQTRKCTKAFAAWRDLGPASSDIRFRGGKSS